MKKMHSTSAMLGGIGCDLPKGVDSARKRERQLTASALPPNNPPLARETTDGIEAHGVLACGLGAMPRTWEVRGAGLPAYDKQLSGQSGTWRGWRYRFLWRSQDMETHRAWRFAATRYYQADLSQVRIRLPAPHNQLVRPDTQIK